MRNAEKILRALANKRRLNIVKYLDVKKGASVGDIASAIKLSFRATSRHLNVLYIADLVAREQVGLKVIYRIPSTRDAITKAVLDDY